MKKINKILVPTDFSNTAQNAFQYAIWFAQHYGASLELVHVVQPEAEALDYPAMVTTINDKRLATEKEHINDFIKENLAVAQEKFLLEVLPDVVSVVELGAPGELIAGMAKKDTVDLIIMGTQGKHSIAERIFGSMSVTSLRKASCPVLIVPEFTQLHKLEKVVYATNLTPADPFHIWVLGQLLAPFSVVLDVVHIQEEPEEEKTLTIEDLGRFFADHPPTLQLECKVIKGMDVAEELVDFLENWEADLLVMHRPQRGMLEGIFHKSRTRKAAMHTKTPLLVLQ